MKYEVEIPKPSAKRLEKNRTLIVRCHTDWEVYDRERITIPEDIQILEFDFNGEIQHCDPNVLDGNWYHEFLIEYQNSTGSRKEYTKVTPREI